MTIEPKANSAAPSAPMTITELADQLVNIFTPSVDEMTEMIIAITEEEIAEIKTSLAETVALCTKLALSTLDLTNRVTELEAR